MYRTCNQHQTPVLPELPALRLWLHGGWQLQSLAHRDKRSSSLCTVSIMHRNITSFSFSLFSTKLPNRWSHVLQWVWVSALVYVVLSLIKCMFVWQGWVWINIRLCFSFLQEALSGALSRYCGCSHFQCLPPELRQWFLTRFLFTILFLPVCTLHHQLLLLSQTQSPASCGTFYSTLAQNTVDVPKLFLKSVRRLRQPIFLVNRPSIVSLTSVFL